MNTNKQ